MRTPVPGEPLSSQPLLKKSTYLGTRSVSAGVVGGWGSKNEGNGAGGEMEKGTGHLPKDGCCLEEEGCGEEEGSEGVHGEDLLRAPWLSIEY